MAQSMDLKDFVTRSDVTTQPLFTLKIKIHVCKSLYKAVLPNTTLKGH